MQKEKVLHYVTIMNRAGEETFIMNVFRNINADKVSFGFLCSSHEKGDYDDEIIELGGKINYVNLSKKRSPLKRIINFYLLYVTLKKLKSEYDIFHIHTQHAMDAVIDTMAAKIAGFKLVIVHSHSTSTLYHKKAHKIFRPVLRNMKVNRLACSDDAGMWLFGKSRRYSVVCNGIDLEKFRYNDNKRAEKRRELGIEKDYFLIGHVGSFTYPKNHEFIIKIFDEVYKDNKNARLVLAGEGPLMQKIKDMVKEKGLESNVLFLGMREDTAELYSAMDAFVFPSHFEGLGIVAVEAQAAGLPCIISNDLPQDLGMTELAIRISLNEGAIKWAERLLGIYNNRIEKKRQSKINDGIIKSGYDIKEVVKKLEKIYLAY